MRGADFAVLASGQKRRFKRPRLPLKIRIHGSALIVRWVKKIPGTRTMITGAFGVTIVASAGHAQMIFAIGGGFVIIVLTEVINATTEMTMAMSLVVPHCQEMKAHAPTAKRFALGRNLSIISGTLRSKLQQP